MQLDKQILREHGFSRERQTEMLRQLAARAVQLHGQGLNWEQIALRLHKPSIWAVVRKFHPEAVRVAKPAKPASHPQMKPQPRFGGDVWLRGNDGISRERKPGRQL